MAGMPMPPKMAAPTKAPAKAKGRPKGSKNAAKARAKADKFAAMRQSLKDMRK